MEIGFLTNQFTTFSLENVNTIGAQGKTPKLYDLDIEKEEKYLDREVMVFEPRTKGLIKTLVNKQGNQGWNCYGYKNKDQSREREMVTRDLRMTIKRRGVHIFPRGTMILI